MVIQNVKRWSRFSALQSVGGTVVLTMAALLIRLSLAPLIQPFAVFHFFILSCLAIQYLFGYRYALAGMVASVLLGEYFFVEPIGTFDELLFKDVIISLNFITVTLTAVVVMEILQRGIYTRELLLKVGDSRHLVSLQRENDRLYYAQKSSEAWYVLELLIKGFDRLVLMQYGQDPVRLEPLFYQLVGLPPAATSTLAWLEGVHPDDRPVLTRHFEPAPLPRRLPAQFTLRFGRPGVYATEATPVRLTRLDFMGHPLLLLALD